MLHAHAAICKEKVYLNRKQGPLIDGSHILKFLEAVKFLPRNGDSLLRISKGDGRNCPGKQYSHCKHKGIFALLYQGRNRLL